MEHALTIVPYGENLGGKTLSSQQVVDCLQRLEQSLDGQRLTWKDVGLLYVANAKWAESHDRQNHNDQSLLNALNRFCAEREWFPSLIGATAFASFFRSPVASDSDITDGILFVAVCSAAFDKIPVVYEISESVDERPFIGRRLLAGAISAFRDKASLAGVDMKDIDVTGTTIGILLTTGSGHIEKSQRVDFRECYAIGQELLEAAEEVSATIVGGCASNRGPETLQTLYFSIVENGRTQYRSTYSHAGVFAFLPYGRARLELAHPYRRDENVDKLEIEFNTKDQYQEGRSFYVERIDGRDVIDFLAEHWPYNKEQLLKLAVDGIPIPAEPDAHMVTIASSLSKRDKRIWPNIPVWLEDVEGTLLMRMVRAEDDDANYYLMRLQNSGLRENARDLMSTFTNTFRPEDNLLAFLCESRKYVLNKAKSNAEATEMITKAPAESCVLGVYVNGEYSTGLPRSIGYHNYSQIGAIIPRRPLDDVSDGFRRNADLDALELFGCHASPDKYTVYAMMRELQVHLHGTTTWIDEKEIGAGQNLSAVIKSVVGRSRQLVIAFLTPTSVGRQWVKQEVKWALDQETAQARTILLPVVIDETRQDVLETIKTDWEPALYKAITDRFFIQVNDFTEAEMKLKAQQLAAGIRKIITPPSGGPMHDPFASL